MKWRICCAVGLTMVFFFVTCGDSQDVGYSGPRILSEHIKHPTRRRALVADVATLIEKKVEDSEGASGTVLNETYENIIENEPGFVTRVVNYLLPMFTAVLDPYYDTWRATQTSTLRLFFDANATQITRALIAVTDEYVQGADNAVIETAYNLLLPSAEEYVIESIQSLADLISEHVQ